MYVEYFQITAHQAHQRSFFDQRYTVQRSNCRKSGAKVVKKNKLATKYIKNLIFTFNFHKIYQILYSKL